MIAAMQYNEADGISKKICLQAAALSNINGLSVLFCLGDNCILEILFEKGVIKAKRKVVPCIASKNTNNRSTKNEIIAIKKLLEIAEDYIVRLKPSYIYIRHMIPQPKLVTVLRKAKHINAKIGYEIPTYPYYREQMNVSKNRAKTLIKLTLETLFWPIIYYYIDKLFVMRCNSKSKNYKKMISIKNGYSGEKNKFVARKTKNLVMIGVGTIYPYHGYDRIINAMKKCGCKLASGGDIVFHIVGQSEEIERLKKLVTSKEERHIVFHGQQFGQELKELYYSCNLGIGTMALSLRNADIDTAIKNIEYFAHDLPVITSGKIFDIPESSGTYLIENESNDIDLDKVAKFVINYYNDEQRESRLSGLLLSFSWNDIMKNAVRKL